MGLVLLIMMLKVEVMPWAWLAAAGWKPEWKPVTLLFMEIGWHGWSKVDWVTVWLPKGNWN